MKSLKDIQVGDIILADDGEECTVAMRSGDIVVYIYERCGIKNASANFHIDELIKRGFTLKAPAVEEWPKINDEFFCITYTGKVARTRWEDCDIDYGIRDFLGIFRTAAEAEERVAKIKKMLGEK